MTHDLLAYSLRSALVLTLLYVPYMLILRHESFFRLNRLVLLLILLLSLVLPALDIRCLAWEGFAPVQTALGQVAAVEEEQPHAVELPEVAVHGVGESGVSSSRNILPMLFVLVMAGVALLRLFQMARMRIVMRRGSLWQQTCDGVRIYCHADDAAPYSWMNAVVISERDYRENGREILLHETAHIRARHSWDLLFLALVQTLQWWNPLVYILGGSMRDIHEYEADDSVLRHGVSARAYQLLLIKKVVGSSSYAFANNFNHSLTIKRIAMMQKTKSRKWMYSKVLYLLPMATLALSAFATVSPSAAGADIGAGADNEGKVSTLTWNAQANVQENVDTTRQTVANSAAARRRRSGDLKVNAVMKPAVMAEFPGGAEKCYEYMAKNMRYPAEALYWGIQGRVLVQFHVDSDGTIGSIGTVRPIRYYWQAPSVDKNGKLTAESTWHHVSFDKETPESAAQYEAVVTSYARMAKAQGKELTDEDKASVRAGVEALVKEIVRVVSEMPRWTPAYEDAAKTKPCVTQFTLPIMFRLN